ncbi:hypothetical protein TH61_12605 [Rufibacter sp. DG15C]|uniref:hypothetical protein n=1 Tax=Rufibacter sp. DG15C TaxID=1379909 RepID=UPI00078BAAAC|nr:hypothetical protein [Rufibacter sp. DG15C]AMM51850.1 hypothetical protein TH61_12605 [Rufibacter sp. DG15C]
MLNRVAIILNEFDFSKKDRYFYPGIKYVFVIKVDVQLLQGLLAFIYSSKDFNDNCESFALCFQVDGHTESQIEEFVRSLKEEKLILNILFHPLFSSSNCKPYMYLASEEVETPTLSLISDAINLELALEPSNTVEIHYIPLRDILHEASSISLEYIENHYVENYLLHGRVEEDVFVNGALGLEESNLVSILGKTEERFKISNPILYNSLLIIKSERQEIRKLKVINYNYEKELLANREYLRVLRNTKQYEEVLKFYTNEYEVLPLWFKRVGHVIKVVTGKRTLKSLFNKNYIKYLN